MKVNIFKYFIATIAAMTLVCSCNKNSIDTPTIETPSAIEFANISTKAALNDLSDLKSNGFGVWAFICNSSVTNSLHMDNTHVEYKEDEASWEYSPLKYWLPETVFNFIATYPRDPNGVYYTFDSNNFVVKLTVAETPSHEDFLIATNLIDTSDESFDATKAVNLEFQHLLTSVEFNIWMDGGKHQNDLMRIRQVTLSNIRKSGIYSSDTGVWIPENNKLNLEYTNQSETDYIGTVIIKGDGTLDKGIGNAGNPFGEMMLLPQTMNASNKVSLQIHYQLRRAEGEDNWEDAELEAILPYGTWEPNRRYTYNVVLSSVKDITFYYIQTNITSWGAPQVGGTIIIK